MNLDLLVSKQKELDHDIYLRHNLIEQSTLEDRFLALKVELSEVANEVRSFKYWSSTPPSSKDVIGFELVDFLHFMISIGITLNFEFPTISQLPRRSKKPSNEILTRMVNDLYFSIMRIELSYRDNEDHICSLFFAKLFRDFFAYANALGFTLSELEDYYNKKNDINIKRQLENY